MTNCWQLKMVLIKIQLAVEKGLFCNGFKGVPAEILFLGWVGPWRWMLVGPKLDSALPDAQAHAQPLNAFLHFGPILMVQSQWPWARFCTYAWPPLACNGYVSSFFILFYFFILHVKFKILKDSVFKFYFFFIKKTPSFF